MTPEQTHRQPVSLLTVKQFKAARPEIGEGTVRAWIREGRIRTVRVGRRILIPGTEVQDLIERETRTA